jgi:hypothetical protein
LLAVTLGSCKTTTQCDAYGKIKNYKKLWLWKAQLDSLVDYLPFYLLPYSLRVCLH